MVVAEHRTRRRKPMGIGEAADELGVDVQTLRRWADAGLVATIRLPSGFRRFEPKEIARLRRELGYRDDEEV